MGKHTPPPVTAARREQLCQQQGITLNGNPARISGSQLDFAVVRETASGLGCEWAWETVALIVSRGGAFES